MAKRQLTSVERWYKIFPMVMRSTVRHIDGDEFKKVFLEATDYFKRLIEDENGAYPEIDLDSYSEDGAELFEMLIGWMKEADKSHRDKSETYSENGKKGGRGRKKTNGCDDESNRFEAESNSFNSETNRLQAEAEAEAEIDKEADADADVEKNWYRKKDGDIYVKPLANANANRYRSSFDANAFFAKHFQINKLPDFLNITSELSTEMQKVVLYLVANKENVKNPMGLIRTIVNDWKDNDVSCISNLKEKDRNDYQRAVNRFDDPVIWLD